MSTRYETCPTCATQTSISVCDNCGNDIPPGTNPTVSARVWNASVGGFDSLELCETCSGQDLNILAIINPPTPEPTEPTPVPQPEQPSEPAPTPTDAGATDGQ